MLSNIKDSSDNDFGFGIKNSIKPKQVPSLKTGNNFNNKINKLGKEIGYYAKKGEPVYDKEMDGDEDGIVTFDEFKEYCENNDVDPDKLLKNWLVYRTVQNEEKVTKEIVKEIDGKEEDSEENEIIYAKKGEEKYDEKMDLNNDDKVTYKEYLEYCKEHANQKDNEEIQSEIDSNTKKAIDKYTEFNSNSAEEMVEIEA